MILYISSTFESFPNCISVEQRKISRNVWDYHDLSDMNVLQSYAYMKPEHAEHYKDCKNFLMDSGAFTLMVSNKKGNIKDFDIRGFAKKYGEFIRKYNIDKFIELDIDGIFDMDTYIDCLHILQDSSGKDPMRVFHGWRGKEYFLELVKQKDYICFGGVAPGEMTLSSATKHFQWFLDKAHENNCKVHGLAFTSPEIICK